MFSETVGMEDYCARLKS